MANHGIGSKFVSVNLNKSYGQASHAPSSSSYGPSRARAGSHGGGGGGGGMVVLSRPRSSHKPGSKLSVPPPLNLPSLRKEHERFDLLRPGSGQAGNGSSGSGSRPNSSGMGWTKPGTVALQEKDGVGDHLLNGKSLGEEAPGDDSVSGAFHCTVDGVSRGSGTYMPPSVRTSTLGVPVSSSAPSRILPVEKAMVLRGEDFPSLQASLPAASGPTQKQKDSLQQKQNQCEKPSNEQRDDSRLSSFGHMHPHARSSHYGVGNGLNENGGGSHDLDSHHVMDQTKKQEEYFPGPLPLVRFNPRSDWADDERDTSHGLTDRGRDHAIPKAEAYWDGDFDISRGSTLPHKSTHNVYNRWGQHENGSREVPKLDSYGSDVRIPSREGQEGNSWRSSHFQKGGSNVHEVAEDRTGISARASSINREKNEENKFFGDGAHDNFSGGAAGKWDSAFGRRDVGYGQAGRQQWNQMTESPNNSWAGKNTRYGSEQYNRYRGDAFQNISGSKSSSAVKGLSINDPILNKLSFSKGEKPYIEDPYLKEFNAAGFGLVKKKKDAPKQADFHDPVRESFEAELERVQKMQEQERQRIIEEQERAIELARIEEEERTRMAREQEERQRRMEEEAREAAWRAEQEHLEALRRAEEQRIAIEEEKRRILMEEERRKQAAKQKLLELEARIAKRQAEESKRDTRRLVSDDGTSGVAKEKGLLRAAEMGDWEDSEAMVERITTSASSDSSSLSRPFEAGSRPHFSRDGSSTFPDRGKSVNLWRRDVLENGNNSAFSIHDQANGLHSPRAISRKEVNGGGEFTASRNYLRGGTPDTHVEDFNNLRGQRWNLSGDGDHYSRSAANDLEFHENFVEKSGDGRWGQGVSHGGSYSSYPERPYQNPELDGLYSYGRSRYSMRQPRVLPPPSVSSIHKMPLRGATQRPGPSTLVDSEMQYSYTARNEPPIQPDYGSDYQDRHEHSDIIDVHQHRTRVENNHLDRNTTPGCDSQSSLSVSSPPNSPPHLSHDDLDESGDLPIMPVAAEGKVISLKGSQPASLTAEVTKESRMRPKSSISADDEEWTNQNSEQMQEQEEYDEDEDGYQEEDEVHEGDEENIDLTQEFEDLHLEERDSPPMVDNLVLGFDEGVQVGLPNDECERSSRLEENAMAMPQVSIGTTEVQGPFDGKALQPVSSFPQVSIDSSARAVWETEKSVQDLVAENKQDSNSSAAPDILDSVDDSSSTGLSTHPLVQSSADTGLNSSSGQSLMSSVSPATSQAELPMKLQFGLFSGPSLIPSPVPAIQIGSIQMPLHLHPQVGPSIPHLHPSQPPLFQFGQLTYTSPVPQGVLPLAPQSMSYLQPNVPAHYAVNQNLGGSMPIRFGPDTSISNLTKDDALPPSKKDRPGLIPGHLDLSQEEVFQGEKQFPVTESGERSILANSTRSESGSVGENQVRHDGVANVSLPYNKELEGQVRAEASSSMSTARDTDSSGSKPQGLISGSKAKKFFNIRNSGSRSSFLAPEASRSNTSGFQRRHRRNIPRTEFRVRENPERQQSLGLVSSNHSGLDDKSNFSGRVPGISARSGSKREIESRSTMAVKGSGNETSKSQKILKGTGKETLKGHKSLHPGEGNLKRNIYSEDDVDAPLQSGVVRVFEQPGIEAPSDEDDFIEVRSKRQMLNDRREQKEKEIKAKSRVSRMPRKTRSPLQSTIVSTSSSKVSSSSGREVANSFHSDFVRTEKRSLADTEVSAAFSTSIVSQPLAPIGPPVNSDNHADMRPQTTKSLQTSPLGGKSLGPSITHDIKNKVADSVQTSVGSWGNARTTQQVMPLTQSQLDEAMKPAQFETHAADDSVSVSEPSVTSSAILAKEKSFSSSSSPINSLLAGEKIQFGAVTSPTILPPSTRVVSHGIGPPGPTRSDIQIPPSLSAAENDCNLLDESCVHLEDSEAEAEAAASAVAVAAISSDEVGKSFGGADIDGFSTDVAGDQQLSSQSRGEESLTVALPADLSVETPPVSHWPPLPTPPNSSTQMLSHFPGGLPSHFPFYDMNPMLGGPIFAFGPHEEPSVAHSQPKSSTSGSGTPLGTWQHHSGVDSFYGPPAGFTGPFISPPGGIPGVQGPPHMVVYNHFAPVGQYGQVGLSFMGTTYVPSGKQPDWKHNPASTAMGGGEGDLNNINMVSAQRNPPNIPVTGQHLAHGSPLLPMASPLAMFDVSPFQTSPDMSVQAPWSHVSAPPLPSVPLSLPPQQQPNNVLRSQFSHGSPVDQSLTTTRFSESQTSTPSNGAAFPSDLGLVDSAQTDVSKSTSGTVVGDSGKATVRSRNNGTDSYQSSNFKTQSSQQKNSPANQYYSHAAYNYRRTGFHGRNPIMGPEKSLHPTKVKQIYVAKQTNSGRSSVP